MPRVYSVTDSRIRFGRDETKVTSFSWEPGCLGLPFLFHRHGLSQRLLPFTSTLDPSVEVETNIDAISRVLDEPPSIINMYISCQLCERCRTQCRIRFMCLTSCGLDSALHLAGCVSHLACTFSTTSATAPAEEYKLTLSTLCRRIRHWRLVTILVARGGLPVVRRVSCYHLDDDNNAGEKKASIRHRMDS